MSELIARDLAKSFGRRRVLQTVSLRVAQGEIVGLLGPNGAGKTTCFYLLTGMIGCERGQIMLGDNDITRLPVHRRARMGLSYLPQESSVFVRLTALENVAAVLEIQENPQGNVEKRALSLLNELGVAHLAHQRAAALSGGERRRVEIARLLAASPRFVLLDEPFAAIEPIAIGDLQNLIVDLKRRNIGVVVTDHNVRETLKICDHAFILGGGKVLAQGAPAEIAANPAVRKAYLGEEFRM